MEEKEFVNFLSSLPAAKVRTEQFYESDEFKKIFKIIIDGTYFDMERNLSEEEKEICVNKIFEVIYGLNPDLEVDGKDIDWSERDFIPYLKSIKNEDVRKSIIEKSEDVMDIYSANIGVIKKVILNPETRSEMYSKCIKIDYIHQYDCEDIDLICFEDDIDVWRKVLENCPDKESLKNYCKYMPDNMSYFDDSFFGSKEWENIVPRLELCQEYYNNAKDKKEPDVDLIGKYIELREEKIKENNEKIEDKKETVEQLNWKAKLAEQESILSAQETEIADLDRQIADLNKEQK